jgi:hypothetical protein
VAEADPAKAGEAGAEAEARSGEAADLAEAGGVGAQGLEVEAAKLEARGVVAEADQAEGAD